MANGKLTQSVPMSYPAEEPTKKRQTPSFMKYIDPTGDPSFWKEVEDKLRATDDKEEINKVLNQRRAERMIEEFCDKAKEDRNPILVMIIDWYTEYTSNPISNEFIGFNIFEREVSLIAQTIITIEYAAVKGRYDSCWLSQHNLVDKDTGVIKTLLHALADANRGQAGIKYMKTLTNIAKCLLSFDPSLVYATTECEEWEKLPVELALMNYDDEMAALLIDSMKIKDRVRSLFQYDYLRNTPARFKFIDYINKPNMKKTVVAVLDSMMSPCVTMPFCDDVEISFCAAKQLRCYFRILDADLEGRCEDSDGDGKANWSRMSCLQALCLSDMNKIAMEHPVVRLLARRKWDLFGRFHVRLHLAFYTSFLLIMSFALIGDHYVRNREKSFLVLISFCEISTLTCCIIYMLIEVSQYLRERSSYFLDAYNYLDIAGLVSLSLVIILRWLNTRQAELASCAFLLNYLRLFKFLSAFKSCGVYLATLSLLIKENLPVFLAVYVIILTGFSGASFIAINGGSRSSAAVDLPNVFLRGIRGITEGQVFAEDYSNFSTFAVLLILGGTMASSVILANVLIAQLSESYAVAKSNAMLHYDIARLNFVTKIENSRFKFLNLRSRHYQESTLSCDENL